MKTFFQKHQKLHIWLLTDLVLLAAYFLCRQNRTWMNALAEHVTTPLKQAAGRLCYMTELSIMEVLTALLVIGGIAYAVWSVIAIVRARGYRKSCAYRTVVRAACIGLSIYAGFCLLWGVNFWTDSFQDKSGIYAEPVAAEDLLKVTVYFAQQLALASDDVERTEDGVFAVPREEILARAPHVYDAIEEQFPFLEFEDPGVKAMRFSYWMSVIDFTGFYCPYTGESNVNVHSPACSLPGTVAHELGHQRGIASEQECNFLAVLASVTCDDPAYRYSGWLKGYIHLSNALYSLNRDVYWQLRDLLPAEVEADLRYISDYWEQFRDTKVQQVSTQVYDGVLKAYGDERGIQSYGTVVDMLVAYYKDII